MSTNETRRISLLTLAGRALPRSPPIRAYPAHLWDDGIAYVLLRPGETEPASGLVEIPSELYLRELIDLDAEDPEAMLSVRERLWAIVRHLPPRPGSADFGDWPSTRRNAAERGEQQLLGFR